jgi:hypothetical protein
MPSNRMNWLIAASVIALLGAAVVTLRAAETSRTRTGAVATRGGLTSPGNVATGANATPPSAASVSNAVAGANGTNTAVALTAAGANPALPAGSAKQHPPPSAPEESATIKDDPTTAPDPSQSADNNVSFPTDI